MDQQLFPSFLRLLMHLRLTLQHSIVHVLILRFPIALIVAWTPDPRFFNAKCSLLCKVTLLLSESASNSRVFLSWCMALDRNTSYPDIVCWYFPQNEEDPMSYVLLDSHKNSALSITPASLNARISIYHCLFDTFQAVCITCYSQVPLFYRKIVEIEHGRSISTMLLYGKNRAYSRYSFIIHAFSRPK